MTGGRRRRVITERVVFTKLNIKSRIYINNKHTTLPMNTEFVDSCACCNKTDVKLSLCGRCRAAKYCSRECQNASWPQHKVNCVESDTSPISKVGPEIKAIITNKCFNPFLYALALHWGVFGGNGLSCIIRKVESATYDLELLATTTGQITMNYVTSVDRALQMVVNIDYQTAQALYFAYKKTILKQVKLTDVIRCRITGDQDMSAVSINGKSVDFPPK